MAGRFSRLEFDDQHEREQVEARSIEGTPVRTAQHYALQAEQACRSGRFESGLQQYTRWVREDRAAAPAWVGQVQMLVQLREYAEARLWSDKALELFRQSGELLAAKAQACQRQGDRSTALACSDASLRSPGSSAWRWEVRGEVMLARGQSLFRDCFQRALAESGADWFDRLVISKILLFYDRAAAALEYAQQAVELRPAHPYNWLVMGECQEAIGLVDPAETSYRRCLELDPGHAAAARAIEALHARPFMRSSWRRIRSWLRR